MTDAFGRDHLTETSLARPRVSLALVPPPSQGLGSNFNYFIDANCENLLNLKVTIETTEDLVWQSSDGLGKGFSIQINGFSPMGATAAWLQYVLILADDPKGTPTLYGGVEYWPKTLDNDLFNARFTLATLPKLAIPAGYLLEMRLENAENTTVNAMNARMVNVGVVPAPRSNIHSYAGNNGEHHINFIGADREVRELFYRPGEGWVNNSLTQLAGSPGLPSGDSPLAGYARAGGDQHVFYISQDGHVHEFHIEPGGYWADNDLTLKSGNGVGAWPVSALDAYAGSDGGQHVNFIGSDWHVRELYLAPGQQWAE